MSLTYVPSKLVIAIDGPAGAGKSTIAKLLAQRLNILYLDTGAMYRALTWKALLLGISISDEARLADLFRKMKMEVVLSSDGQRILVDDEDFTPFLRQKEVSELVSPLSAHGEVRKIMVHKQRELAEKGQIVLDGRDIGTVVLPNAPLKIYLTATLDERTHRRQLEYQQLGISVDFETLKAEISARDCRDSSREHAPLQKAQDAVLIDSTDMTANQVAERIEKLCRDRGLIGERDMK
ncbi:Cytidylate kinase [bioreactor metagenome]|uniref:(d)CMP kinase n=1 Tax=bioreactor metagenome TaxID=1076179 RepID=A0A645AN08_9ZZZZ